MGRQKEVDKIAKIIEDEYMKLYEAGFTIKMKSCDPTIFAEALVDNGIRSSDGFEIIPDLSTSENYVIIEPIEWEEK